MMNRETFLAILRGALAEIREPRLFKTERGYQGELLAGLKSRRTSQAIPSSSRSIKNALILTASRSGRTSSFTFLLIAELRNITPRETSSLSN
jgi:hypothetical protein